MTAVAFFASAMPPAFATPAPLCHRRVRHRTLCLCLTTPSPPSGPEPAPPSDEPGPGPPASRDAFTSADRAYADKVRARLFRAPRPAPADIPDDDATLTASLPDDLDQLDDILYDRAPANAGRVRLFGAWLDRAVAGRSASDPSIPASPASDQEQLADQFDVQSYHKISLSKQEALECANDAFAAAMAAFNKGQYKLAVDLYADAVDFVGVQSRLGGQYRLWHAQALDAAGCKKEAAHMLETLRNHADQDVRKVSRELHFIITAPKLEVEPGTFLDIPVMDDDFPSLRMDTVLTSNYGPLRAALMEKKPERYSLQWYMEKERPPKVKDHATMDLVLVAAAICFTLAVMFTTSSPS